MNNQYTYREMILSYLAGCMDCDGYFGIGRSKHTGASVLWNVSYIPKAGLKQIHPDIPVLLKDMFGGSTMIQPASSKNGRELFLWSATHRSAIRCAESLIPYLVLKRRQAKLIVQLGKSLARPYNEITERLAIPRQQMNRWGQMVDFRRNVLCQYILNERECIFQEFRLVQRETSETSVIEQAKHPEFISSR